MKVVLTISVILVIVAIFIYLFASERAKKKKSEYNKQIYELLIYLSSSFLAITYSYVITDTMEDWVVVSVCCLGCIVGYELFGFRLIDSKKSALYLILLIIALGGSFYILSIKALLGAPITMTGAVFGTVIGHSIKKKKWVLVFCGALALAASFMVIGSDLSYSTKIDLVTRQYMDDNFDFNEEELIIYKNRGLRGEEVEVFAYIEKDGEFRGFDLTYYKGAIISKKEM